MLKDTDFRIVIMVSLKKCREDNDECRVGSLPLPFPFFRFRFLSEEMSRGQDLGPVQTSNFTCTESNANEQEQ